MMKGNEKEKILNRLAKLKALADGGVGGERENAARLLEEVARKYGVDLDSLVAEVERDHDLDFKVGWRPDLLAQLVCLTRIEQYGDRKANHCLLYETRRGGKIVGHRLHCTDAQWLEIMAKFEVLSRDYEKQRAAFFRAFLEANDLLAPYDPDGEKPTSDELAEAELARRMSRGIMKTQLRKQIGPGEMDVREGLAKLLGA